MAAEEKIASLTVDGSSALSTIDQIGARMETVGEKVEANTRRLASYGRDFQTVARALGVYTDASERVIRVQAAAQRAVDAGRISQEQANRIVGEAKLRYDETARAARDAAEAQQQAAAEQTRANTALVQSLEQVRRQYDPAYAATAKYKDEVARVSRILDEAGVSGHEYAATLQAVAAALDPLARAERQRAQETARAAEETAQAQAALAAELERVRSRYSPTSAEVRRYQDELNRVTRVLEAANVAEEERIRILGEVAAAYDPVVRAEKERADAEQRAQEQAERATQEMIERERATQRAADAQERFNRLLGVSSAPRSSSSSAAGSAGVFEDADREAQALQRLVDHLEPATAAQRRFAEQQRQLDAALASRRIDETQHTRLSAALRAQEAAFSGAARSANAHTRALQILSPQISDIGVQAYAGTSALTILVQQGPQIADGLIAAGREAVVAAGRFALMAAPVLAIGAALGAVAYGAARFNGDVREFDRTARLTGNAAGVMSGQFADFGDQVAAAAGVSQASAREIVTAYAGTGRIGAGVLSDLTKATKSWALLTGRDTDEASADLAKLFSDPAKAVDELTTRYGMFDAAQARVIKNYQAQGNLERAQQLLLQGLETRAAGAAEKLTAVERGWAALKTLVSDGVDVVARSEQEPSRQERISRLRTSVNGWGNHLTEASRQADQDELDRLEQLERDDGVAAWAAGVRAEFVRASHAAEEFARSVDPAIAAQETLENRSQELAKAVALGALPQQEATRLLGLYRRQLLDALDPAQAFSDAMERQARLLERVAGRSRDFEQERLATLEKRGAKAGDSLTADETAKINAGLDRKYAAEAADRHRTAQEAIQDARALAAATASLSQPAILAAQAQATFFDVLRKTSDYKQAKQAEDDVYAKGMVEWSAQVDASVKTSSLAVDAARRLAAAQARGGDIAQAQAQAQNVYAEQIARGVDPVRALTLANADYQKSLAGLAGQQAAWNRDLGEQIAAARRLAQAEGVSSAAVAEATTQNKIRAQILKEGVALESERAQAIAAGTRALEAQNAIARVNASIRQQNQDLELARAEFALLGRSNAERERTVAIMKAAAEVQASADWQAVPQATRDAWIAQAGAVADYQARVADASETSRDFASTIAKGFEDALVSGAKLGDLLKGLEADLKRIAVRGLITKPLETYVTGNLTKLLAGAPPGDSQVKPVTASDPGGYQALFDKLTGGAGALGSQANPMWVRTASGAPTLDVRQLAGGTALPVAIKDAGGLEAIAERLSAKHGVDANLIKAIIQQESSWNPAAVNPRSGAAGLMQVMPANWSGYGITNPYDPERNIEAGIRIYKEMLIRSGGDVDKALSLYSGHIKTSGAAYVAAVKGSKSAYDQAGSAIQAVSTSAQSVESSLAAQVQAQQAGASTTQALTSGQQDAVSAALATVRSMDAVAGTAEDVDTRWGAVSDSSTTAVQKMADAQLRAADTMAGGAAVFARGAQQAGAYMVSGSQQAAGALISIIGAASGIQGGGIPGQVVQAGGPAGIQSSLQQLGGLLSSSSAGNAFSGVKEVLNTPIAGLSSIGYTAPTAAPVAKAATNGMLAGGEGASTGMGTQAAAGGATWGDALGAVGYGFNAFQNFQSGNTIGGIGNVAAAAMMFIPGAQVFAPFVAIGSTLLGGMFGGRGDPTAAATVTYSGTRQVASSYDQDNDGSLEQAQQLLSSIDAATTKFIGITGGKTAAEFGVGIEAADGKYKARTLDGELSGDYGSLDTAVIAAFKSNVSKGLISASDDVLTAVANSTKTDINEWLSDVSFGKGFRSQFESMLSGLDPVSNQIKTFTEASKQLGEQVQTNITDWMDTASRLGLATESELTTAAKRGIEAMMGLGPVTRPLAGIAAVTKQAEINFEAFRPALQSLGYTAEEITTLAGRYTAELETTYTDAVSLLQRQGGVSIAKLDGRGSSLSAADQFRIGGATLDTVTAPAFAAVADTLDAVTAVARRGALTFDQVETAWTTLNTAVYDGVLTADQYTTAVGMVTAAFEDSQTVLSTLRSAWATVEAITDPGRRQTATDVLDNAMVRGGADGVAAFRGQLDGLFNAIGAGTATTTDLAYTYERAVDLYKAGSVTGEQFNRVVASMVSTWDDATKRASYNADITSRMFAAVGNSRTAGLLALDQEQATELTQARASGYDTSGLVQLQAAERAAKAFELAQADILGYYDQQITAQQDLITNLQEGAVAAAAVARQFRAAYDSLALDDNSPLSDLERLQEARRQFEAAYGTATSATASDTERSAAQTQLQQLGPQLVQLARAYYATTDSQDYERVREVFGKLALLPGGTSTDDADKQLQAAQDTLKELQRSRADAARLGERQYGALADLQSVLHQSYSILQQALGPLLAGTGTTPKTYGAPADVQASWDGLSAEQQHGVMRATGWAGAMDLGWNRYLATDSNKAASFESYVRQIAGGTVYASSSDVMQAWTALSAEQQAAAVRAAGYDGGIDSGLNAWVALGHQAAFEQAVRAAARSAGVPGFASGTLSTPPGAVWVGEQGPELFWQGGGAAVASSADSQRIAATFAAVNDRVPPGVVDLRSSAAATNEAALRHLAAEVSRSRDAARQDARAIATTIVEMMEKQIAALREENAELRRRVDKQGQELRIALSSPQYATKGR